MNAIDFLCAELETLARALELAGVPDEQPAEVIRFGPLYFHGCRYRLTVEANPAAVRKRIADMRKTPRTFEGKLAREVRAALRYDWRNTRRAPHSKEVEARFLKDGETDNALAYRDLFA